MVIKEPLLVIKDKDGLMKLDYPNIGDTVLCLKNKSIYMWVQADNEDNGKWIIYSENNTNLIGVFIYEVVDIGKITINTNLNIDNLTNNLYLNGSVLGPKDYKVEKIDDELILKLTLSYSLDKGDRFVLEYFKPISNNNGISLMDIDPEEDIYTGHIIRYDHKHDEVYIKLDQEEIKFKGGNYIGYDDEVDKLYTRNSENKNYVYSVDNKPTLEELGLLNIDYEDAKVANSIEDLDKSHIVDLSLVSLIEDKMKNINYFELSPLSLDNKLNNVYKDFIYLEESRSKFDYKLNYIPVSIPYICKSLFNCKNNLINGKSYEKSITCYSSDLIKEDIDCIISEFKTENSIKKIFSYISKYSGSIKLNLKIKVTNKSDNSKMNIKINRTSNELESNCCNENRHFKIDNKGNILSTSSINWDNFYLEGHDLSKNQDVIDNIYLDFSLTQDVSYIFNMELTYENLTIEDVDLYFSYNIGNKEGFI